VPKNVTLSTAGRTISVKGPVGSLSFDVPQGIEWKQDGAQLLFTRASEDRTHRALHGMARARTANMIHGCGKGFTRQLDITGVGYRAAVKGGNVELELGHSHPISYPLPSGIKAEVTKDGSLIITGADKVLVGQVASDIRRKRPPEPYKGKGVRYSDENILRKEGKRGKK